MYGLSGSTLLYYEKIRLINPPKRSPSGYRLYSEEDKSRLELVVLYRSIGVPLEKIRIYLDTPDDGVLPLLISRLLAINDEINSLKEQQLLLLEMVEAEGSLKGKKPFLEKMTDFGKKAGITEGNYEKIHRVFEKTAPKAHKRFLEYLGFSENEIQDFIKKSMKKLDLSITS